ncbi:MAG TPA: Sec-independent protein translocase protein TatB [Anaerolineae bacterium]|nr:Sec-independent protein translocase protein TatB [Anaerolineae bacterium]
MEVFGIGPLEIALIVLIAFIVLGPDRIPGAMRQLGKWTRQMRDMVNNITRDYNTEIREITGEITALQEEIRNIQRDIGGIATGFMTMTTPPPNTPPARSNTAAPADPIDPERSAASQSIGQILADDVKRASAPPPAAPHAPTPPPTSTNSGTDSDEPYEI